LVLKQSGLWLGDTADDNDDNDDDDDELMSSRLTLARFML